MKAIALIALALWVVLPGRSALAWEPFRSQSSAVERGNEHLGKGQHKEALEAYDQAARELPDDPGVQLDRGLALLGLGKLAEAREAFRRGGAGTAPKDVRAASLYNLGAAFMQEADQAGKAEDLDGAKKLLEEAVDAFKSSLRAQPNNKDAAWNLELAKRRLVEAQQKQEQKTKEQDEQKKQQDQQNKDPQQKQDEQEKQEQEQPKQDEQRSDGGTPNDDAPKEGKGDQDKPQPEPDAGAPEAEPQGGDGGASPEQPREQPSEAEPEPPPDQALPEHMRKALDALEAGEENLQKHRAKQRARTRPRRIEKDW